MKNLISNRVNMINTTITYCDANTAATSGITGFATALAVVKGKIVLVNSLNQIGEGTTTGVTTDTNLLRKTMTDLALKCANGTLAYANSINNNTLKALVNFNEAKLNKMKKEEVDDVCEGIHDATNANAAAVVAYGVSGTDITDLQTAIDVYRTATQNPRNAIISRSQAKKQVKEMVKDIIENLLAGQLDKMVNTLKTTNKNFCSGYAQAREIVDLGSTTAKVRGEVRNEDTAPLKGVLFQILATGTEDVVAETKTDNTGKFSLSKLPAGDFDLKWTLDGYAPVEEAGVHIAAGKELKRKITMKQALVREGELNPGLFGNIDLNGLDDSHVKVEIEAKDSSMRFYATNDPGNGPGGVYLEVGANTSVKKSLIEFAAAVGFGGGNSYLNVFNAGGGKGNWKVTFYVE